MAVAGNLSWQILKLQTVTISYKKNIYHCRTMMRTMKMEICQSTTWMPVTKTTNRLRKRAAALVPPALARPPAPPAPVLGRGPGKRVQVKGNSRQNVSISSIFHMTYWSTSSMSCIAVLSFSLLSSPPHLCWLKINCSCTLNSLNLPVTSGVINSPVPLQTLWRVIKSGFKLQVLMPKSDLSHRSDFILICVYSCINFAFT